MALYREPKPYRITIYNSQGQIILRGTCQTPALTHGLNYDAFDVEIKMDSVDEAAKLVIPSGEIISRAAIAPRPEGVGDVEIQCKANATDIARRLMETLNRKRDRMAAAAAQEKIRNFAVLYGGSGPMMLRAYALQEWRQGVRTIRSQSGYVGQETRGGNRVTKFFDIGDEWAK